MATIATLLGTNPTPLGYCKVLDLGCSSGGNLIAIAEQFSNSQFIGVDASAKAIEKGTKCVEDLRLNQVKKVPDTLCFSIKIGVIMNWSEKMVEIGATPLRTATVEEIVAYERVLGAPIPPSFRVAKLTDQHPIYVEETGR